MGLMTSIYVLFDVEAVSVHHDVGWEAKSPSRRDTMGLTLRAERQCEILLDNGLPLSSVSVSLSLFKPSAIADNKDFAMNGFLTQVLERGAPFVHGLAVWPGDDLPYHLVSAPQLSATMTLTPTEVEEGFLPHKPFAWKVGRAAAFSIESFSLTCRAPDDR